MPKAIPKTPRKLYRRSTAAALLDTSINTLKRLEAEGRLTPVRLGRRDVVAERVGVDHRATLITQDHVTALDAGLLGRATRHDVADQRAFGFAQPKTGRQIVGDALNRDAQPAAMHPAVGDQLIHDVLRHVRRHREPDTDVAARRREDL